MSQINTFIDIIFSHIVALLYFVWNKKWLVYSVFKKNPNFFFNISLFI